MNTKFLFIAVFCFCLGNISCYEYKEKLEEVIQQVDLSMEMYRNSTLMSFYSYQAQNVKMQFDMLASSVSHSDNPYAIAHVITFRKNYTTIPYLLENMINDTRDEIIGTFDHQSQSLGKVLPQVRRTSDDVYAILTQKACNETIIEEFYMNLFYMTSMRVTMSLSEGYSAYMSQLMNQYAPFMLFSTYIMQLTSCTYNSGMRPMSETTACMVQKDDLYLSPTINLIWESLRSAESLVKNFNLKMTGYVVKDVEDTFNRAYKDSLLIKC